MSTLNLAQASATISRMPTHPGVLIGVPGSGLAETAIPNSRQPNGWLGRGEVVLSLV